MLIRLIQTKIGIDRLVCNAIKLSSSRCIHQCSKQDIKRLSRTKDCCIFRVNTMRHEESTEAQNETAQEHYGRKMTMFLGRTINCTTPKTWQATYKNLKESTSASHTEAIGALNNDTRGSCTISKLGVDALRMLIRLVQTKIGIDRLVYNAIKLSSSRGIHQCSKQDIRRLSWTKDCCIFRDPRTSATRGESMSVLPSLQSLLPVF
jgi:hypothetical protein